MRGSRALPHLMKKITFLNYKIKAQHNIFTGLWEVVAFRSDGTIYKRIAKKNALSLNEMINLMIDEITK